MLRLLFLNDELKEEIYIYQPQGHDVEGKEDKVYKLNKSLYGLKQSTRQWYHTFYNAIISYGLFQIIIIIEYILGILRVIILFFSCVWMTFYLPQMI